MTKVRITKDGKSIVRVQCSGHTGYAREGEDIVCAALSSVVQTAVLGLMSVAGIALEYKRDDERGEFEFALPQQMSAQSKHDADIILNTMLCGISDLHEGYSNFINLEVK